MLTLTGGQKIEIQAADARSGHLDGRVVYQSWKLKVDGSETDLTQSALPVTFYLPLAGNWQFHLSSALSRSHLDVQGSTTTISSLAQSTLRIFRSFADDQFFVSAGMVLPTGKTGYDSAEVILTQLLADDYLNIPVKQVGEGLGLLLQAGAASQYNGQLMYGAAVSYFVTGAYTYVEGAEKYNPGDEIAIQGSGTAVFGDGSVDLDLSYRHFLSDKVGGDVVFRNGGVVSIILRGKYSFPNAVTSLTFAQVLRNKNSVQFGSSLQSEPVNSNHNKMIINGSVGYFFTRDLSLSLLAGYRGISANDYGTDSPEYFGKSSLYSFGGGFDYTDSAQRFMIYTRLILSSGDANKGAASNQQIDVSGTEFTVGGRLWF